MPDHDEVVVYRVRSVDSLGTSGTNVMFVARVASIGDGLKALGNSLPDGWTVELSSYRLTPEMVTTLALEPGEVRCLTGLFAPPNAESETSARSGDGPIVSGQSLPDAI